MLARTKRTRRSYGAREYGRNRVTTKHTTPVTADSPGLRETVHHRETGLIVPHGDVDLLAGALARLLEPGERDRMGRKARIMAEEHSWDRVADTVERFLESLARGSWN